MYPKIVQARNAVTPDGGGLQGVPDRKFDGLQNFQIGNMMDPPIIQIGNLKIHCENMVAKTSQASKQKESICESQTKNNYYRKLTSH